MQSREANTVAVLRVRLPLWVDSTHRPQPVERSAMRQKVTFDQSPRSEVVDWLPPHDSNVPSSVNSGAPSPRWLDGNEMVEQRSVELRTSICQDQLQPAACPRNGAQREI